VVLGRYGTLSQGIYLGLGASFGLFTGMTGVAALIGPTGGYIIGFILASLVLGELVERKSSWSGLGTVAIMSLGVLIIYTAGAIQLALVLDLDAWTALLMGVVPFVVVDAIKVLVAGSVGTLFLRPASP